MVLRHTLSFLYSDSQGGGGGDPPGQCEVGVCSSLACPGCRVGLLALRDPWNRKPLVSRTLPFLTVRFLFLATLNHNLVSSLGGTYLPFNLDCTAWPPSER